jgi:hypothetical protein
MTTFKMPEPVGDIKNYTLCTATISADLSTGTKLYTAEALRDVLEQAAQKCELFTFTHPLRLAEEIRAMKELIK